MTIQKPLQSQSFHGIYAIADNTFRPELSHVELAEAFLKGGAKVVQLRMKKPSAVSRQPSEEIMKLKTKYNFTFIINDHVEIAKEIGADGVHVGADDMSIPQARKIVGDQILIGYSSHSLGEAVAAQEAGADYVAFGAIFPTKTKGPGHPVQGLEKLRAVVRALHVPVVAIGGINRDNIRSVLETGVAAVAMITALTEARNIVGETSYYQEVLST